MEVFFLRNEKGGGGFIALAWDWDRYYVADLSARDPSWLERDVYLPGVPIRVVRGVLNDMWHEEAWLLSGDRFLRLGPESIESARSIDPGIHLSPEGEIRVSMWGDVPIWPNQAWPNPARDFPYGMIVLVDDKNNIRRVLTFHKLKDPSSHAVALHRPNGERMVLFADCPTMNRIEAAFGKGDFSLTIASRPADQERGGAGSVIFLSFPRRGPISIKDVRGLRNAFPLLWRISEPVIDSWHIPVTISVRPYDRRRTFLFLEFREEEGHLFEEDWMDLGDRALYSPGLEVRVTPDRRGLLFFDRKFLKFVPISIV